MTIDRARTGPRPNRLVSRRVILLLVLALVGSSMPLRPHIAGAAEAPTRYRDFWLDTYGDAMDFDNAADVVVANDGPMLGLSSPRLADGLLSFTVDRPGYFSPQWGGYDDAIPHGREGSLRPIDASRYGTIVLRMRADRAVDAGVRWYSCKAGVADFCQGGFNFALKEGWETYRFTMDNQADDPALRNARWSGAISGLRVAFGAAAGVHVDVDWIRLVASDPNGQIASDYSVIGTPTRPAALGPVDPRPAKGYDYTDVARKGDRWDFDKKTDVLSSGNVTGLTVSGGQLHGTSKPSTDARPGDPYVLLPLGKPALRIAKYHRVAIRISLAGAYSQQFAVGGGSTLRLRLRFKGRPGFVLTRPIAIYPNEEWIVFDLLDRNMADGRPGDPTDVFDPAYTRGAAHTTSSSILTTANLRSSGISRFSMESATTFDTNAEVQDFGFDPTEDYGPRDFTIDSVHLGADEPASSPAPTDPPQTTAPTGPTDPPQTTAPTLDPSRPAAELQAECWNQVRSLTTPQSKRAALISGLDPWCKSSLPGWPLVASDAAACADLQNKANLSILSGDDARKLPLYCGSVDAALKRMSRVPAPWWLTGEVTAASPTELDCMQMLVDLLYLPRHLSEGVRPSCDRYKMSSGAFYATADFFARMAGNAARVDLGAPVDLVTMFFSSVFSPIWSMMAKLFLSVSIVIFHPQWRITW